jgi:2-dehydropantoate 2-reductase
VPVRYVVLGAGAIGATIGGRLAEGGYDVALVGRGEHARAVKRDGLRLAMPDRIARLRIPMLAMEELRLTSDDVLIVAVKSQDTRQLLDQVLTVPFAGSGDRSDLPVLCAQNGIANEDAALRFFARVYGVCVILPATHLEPGLVEAEGTPLSGVLHLGRYPSGADDVVAAVAADLENSAIGADVRPDVMAWKRAKLVSNLGNALQVLCEGGAGLSGVRSAMTAEAMACFAAAGWPVVEREEFRSASAGRFELAPIEGRPRGGGSTWQSLERGLPSVETDFLNGEIVRLGRLHDVPTPVNAAVQARMRAVVNGSLQPRTVDPALLLS